jgi:IS605 OrfB family transposase
VTFCKEAASKLCSWVPENAVLVFEDLKFKSQNKKDGKRKGTRRKLSQFFYNSMITACRNRAEREGLALALVNPAFTSQKCRICGSYGTRFGSKFSCPCGHVEHADVNASHNIRNIYAALRDSGASSSAPEAQTKTKPRKYKLRKS